MQQGMEPRIEAMRAVADRLYARWARGLKG
jgi:hypothetical protein